MQERKAFRNGVTEWLVTKNPLYMGRIVADVRRSGTAFLVEETNENQTRTWLACNFLDDVAQTPKLQDLFNHLLIGRHKLLSKLNQLKYVEDFYAELNRDKVTKILGKEFSTIGSQWIQLSGDSGVNTTYAWLALSPWGKVWISRLTLLCLALAQMDSFSTSDIFSQDAISSIERPQPVHTPRPSSAQTLRQGDSSITEKIYSVAQNNPARKFQSSQLELEISQRFADLYGLQKYAAVRGDSLWDADNIGKTLGRTILTGTLAMLSGAGFSGYLFSAGDQWLEYQNYLKSSIAEKAKSQCQDLYEVVTQIVAIAEQMSPKLHVVGSQLRDAADDFRKTIPLRFNKQNYNPNSLYYGDANALRQRYRKVSTAQVKTDTAPEHLGIAEDANDSVFNTDRLKEDAALLAKQVITKPKSPAGYLSALAPTASEWIEKQWSRLNPAGKQEALSNSIKSAQEIMGELRVLARESDAAKNTTSLYDEVRNATDMLYSFMSKLKMIAEQMNIHVDDDSVTKPNSAYLPVDPNAYAPK